MNQKELGEIRRRIRPEHNNIRCIYGCYVNTNHEIISTLEESVGLMSREESEQYFKVLKKSLSGALGKNLQELTFATSQVVSGEEHRLLSALRECALEDESLREQFYRSIIDHLEMEEGNYLILIACDIYDVPASSADGQEDDRGDVFKYLVCCVCPVKSGKAELGYSASDRRFRSAGLGQIVASPELGFLFPAFDDRSANIYNALFYSRDLKVSHQDFIDAVFHTPVPTPPARQKEEFDELLTTSLENDCSFDVIQAVHEQLSEQVTLYRESKNPEPMAITPEDFGEILENSGVNGEEVEKFCHSYTEKMGEGALLNPTNLTNAKKMEIATPEVRITVDPQYSYLIQTKIIDGKKFIMISADTEVQINGISVSIHE